MQKLNRDQKQAVKYTKGPLLIIAGAGTGKTTVITERVLHLVTSGLAKTSEILALTFTEKAANQMQERVDIAMPYGQVDMWVSTFHSFCDRVLRTEALNIGYSTDYSLLTLSESVQLVRKHLFEFDLDYFRPVGNPMKFIVGMLSHFSRLQDEDVTPEEYLSWAKKQSKKDQKDLEAAKWLELANAYKKYKEIKAEEGYMDFGDLITKTLELFRKRTNVLTKYQEKFKYILIDEFQDTNYAQNQLAVMIAGNRANIAVVGDDDQSIYRFRGAAISNFKQFGNIYKRSKVVVLSKNYRSRRAILDSAYNLIQFNNPDRLEVTEGISKKLVSQRTGRGKVEFIHKKSIDLEAAAVADKIGKLVTAGKYKWKDFAILVRANSQAEPFVSEFVRRGIPHQFLGPGKLFEQPEIIELASYLKVLTDLADDPALYRVLSIPELEIDDSDVIKMLAYSRRTHVPLWDIVTNLNEVELGESTQEKLIKLTDLVKREQKRLKDTSAGKLLYAFLEETQILPKLLAPNTQEAQKRALNIGLLFEKIRKYENAHRGASVYEIVDWIELTGDMGESPRAVEFDWTEEDAVNILTVHSAKGLEFPVVFLVNAVHLRFPSVNRSDQIPIPEGLIKETLPQGDFHLEEERRLFYVGLTRARDRLYLTAADYYGEEVGRKRKISQFVFEALGEEIVSSELPRGDEQLSLLNYAPDKNIKANINMPPLHVHYLSYSQIDTFKLCPLHYKLQYLLKIPSPPSPALSLGNSVHNTLHEFFAGLKAGNKWKEKKLLALLKRNWVNEGYESRAHEDKAYQKAQKMLVKLYKDSLKEEALPEALEQKFNISLNNQDEAYLRVGGKIDRIDRHSNGEIEIIDYKTGGKLPTQKEVDINMQLTVYALAAAKSHEPPFDVTPDKIKLSLWFLDENVKFTTTRTRDQLEKVVADILEVRAQIENSDFNCSGHPYCDRCEFKSFCRLSKKGT